jgi:hypothetical protein
MTGIAFHSLENHHQRAEVPSRGNPGYHGAYCRVALGRPDQRQNLEPGSRSRIGVLPASHVLDPVSTHLIAGPRVRRASTWQFDVLSERCKVEVKPQVKTRESAPNPGPQINAGERNVWAAGDSVQPDQGTP